MTQKRSEMRLQVNSFNHLKAFSLLSHLFERSGNLIVMPAPGGHPGFTAKHFWIPAPAPAQAGAGMTGL
jgi:hypothetical protein